MTSKTETAVMLLILAIMLPIIIASCNHKSDESYAYQQQQTAQWRAEREQKPYISPADQAVIALQSDLQQGNQK